MGRIFKPRPTRMPDSLRSPEQQKLQDLLAELRKSKGMTQADVAATLDKPQSFVAKYEGGERRLDVVEYIAVVQALGADPAKMLAKIYRTD